MKLPTLSLRQWLLAAGALMAAGLFVYWPSLTGGFIWDDEINLAGNELVKASDGLYRMWFTTEPFDYWPLTNTSYWVEWRLWGTNPLGYHVTNLLLHVGNALLAWAVLRRLNIAGAFLAALIFLVHPVNVESVAWITQRKNTLSMFLFLVSILLYLLASTESDPEEGQSPRKNPGNAKPVTERPSPMNRGGWLILSVLAFALAMLSKGSVVVLPGILLLITWWRRDHITLADMGRVAPFFVVGVALTLVNIWFQTHGGEAIRHATPIERVLGAAVVLWFYLYKALLPIDLSFIYPQWHIDAAAARWWLPLASAVIVTGILIWRRRGWWARPLLFAWSFFVLALVPVMGFTDVYFMKFSLVADHYQYIALLGPCAAIAAAIDTALRMGAPGATDRAALRVRARRK